ncbi:hypothetical protein ASG77_08270 [Arthrobacter sp. Soil762]|nr:hypothetical protein ASG77_08270 [Arthrobacter sp. Soil762]
MAVIGTFLFTDMVMAVAGRYQSGLRSPRNSTVMGHAPQKGVDNLLIKLPRWAGQVPVGPPQWRDKST